MSKKPSKKTLKKHAWTAFAKYIKLKHSVNSMCKCVTCGYVARYDDPSMQAGHFVPGRTNSVLFDEDIVRPQCSVCNVINGGEYGRYFLYYKREELKTDEDLEEFLNRKFKIVKYSEQDLKDIRLKYEKLFLNLLAERCLC